MFRTLQLVSSIGLGRGHTHKRRQASFWRYPVSMTQMIPRTAIPGRPIQLGIHGNKSIPSHLLHKSAFADTGGATNPKDDLCFVQRSTRFECSIAYRLCVVYPDTLSVEGKLSKPPDWRIRIAQRPGIDLWARYEACGSLPA